VENGFWDTLNISFYISLLVFAPSFSVPSPINFSACRLPSIVINIRLFHISVSLFCVTKTDQICTNGMRLLNQVRSVLITDLPPSTWQGHDTTCPELSWPGGEKVIQVVFDIRQGIECFSSKGIFKRKKQVII